MHVIQCDQCEKIAARNESLPLTWFMLDHEVERYGVRGGPWHLCSWDCVEEFARVNRG